VASKQGTWRLNELRGSGLLDFKVLNNFNSFLVFNIKHFLSFIQSKKKLIHSMTQIK
jgi:hypothetical protein